MLEDMLDKLLNVTERFSNETLSKIFLTLLVVSSFLLGALWSQVGYLASTKQLTVLNIFRSVK